MSIRFDLRPADILLIHTRWSPWDALIRFGTASYWNHAALVWNVEDRGGPEPMLVEATVGGICTCSLAKYLGHPGWFDVAVKRFQAPWFQGTVAKRVCELALAHTRTGYDFSLLSRLAVGITWRCVMPALLTLGRLGRRGNHCLPHPRGRNLGRYTCSGLIQWAFVRAVEELQQPHNLPPSAVSDVIFDEALERNGVGRELLSVTPADLAHSCKLTWVPAWRGSGALDTAGPIAEPAK